MSKTKYDPAIYLTKAKELVEKNYSLQQIANELNISRSTLRYWRHRYQEFDNIFPKQNLVLRNKYGQYLPGYGGNPEGRTKKYHALTNALDEFFSSMETVTGEDVKKLATIEGIRKINRYAISVPRLKRFIHKLYELFMNGDVPAGRMLWEYWYGKPTVRIEHTGEEGGPIKFDITEKREEAQNMLMRRIERIKEPMESEN